MAATNTTVHPLVSLPTIIVMGLVLGAVRVVTGPDHLSALIVLSADSSWHSWQLGMCWGAGHSAALGTVTAIFLIVNKEFEVVRFGTYFDFFVGLLVIALGCWSFHHYWQLRPALKDGMVAEETTTKEREQLPLYDSHSSGVPHSPGSVPRARDGGETMPLLTPTPEASVRETWCCGLVAKPSADIENASTQRVTAFTYGIIHGLGGTGGILGVLPAMILNDWLKSWAYLLSFCLASIFVMGIFAATYGEFTGRHVRMSDKLLFQVGIFSSFVLLGVGILWVFLVSTGKLNEVFG